MGIGEGKEDGGNSGMRVRVVRRDSMWKRVRRTEGGMMVRRRKRVGGRRDSMWKRVRRRKIGRGKGQKVEVGVTRRKKRSEGGRHKRGKSGMRRKRRRPGRRGEDGRYKNTWDRGTEEEETAGEGMGGRRRDGGEVKHVGERR